MPVTVATALVLQAAALLLLRHRLGRGWLRRPVPLLVLTSTAYQGLAAVLLDVPSIGQQDFFRYGIAQRYTDSAAFWMSAAMMALTVGYLAVRPERTTLVTRPQDLRSAVKWLDWRLLTALCAPLALLTYSGRGYNDDVASGAGTALSTNLAATFFLALVVLAAFAFLLRYGTRWFLPALVTQSLVLAAAGERSPVVADAVVLIVLLAWAGRRVTARQLTAASALTVVAVLAIMGVRAQQGRMLFYQNTGWATRVTALAGGLTDLTGSVPGQAGPSLVAQLAGRLDGTAFEGGILQAEELGQPQLSPWYVPGSLLLDVPSALLPSKLGHPDDLSPQQLEINDFGLQQVNFLPPLPALYAGFLPWPAVLALMLLLGILGGGGERWLFRRSTPARLVMLTGAVMAALAYDEGLPSMLLFLRATLVIALAVWGAEMTVSRWPRKPSGRRIFGASRRAERGLCQIGAQTAASSSRPVPGSQRPAPAIMTQSFDGPGL